MKNHLPFFVLLAGCIGFVFCGCTKISTVHAYNEWLNQPEHGCIQRRLIAGSHVTVKYQPPAYLAMKDQPGSSDTTIDYSKQVQFLLTIGPAASDNKVLQKSFRHGAKAAYREYVDQIMISNFFMGDHIRLYFMGESYKPVLTIVENVYELSDSRNFMVVFSDPALLVQHNGEDYVFVYEDPFWEMGKIQFRFSEKNIATANQITSDRFTF